MKTFKNYFDAKYPNDNLITRKVRIGFESFKRILKDSPKIEKTVAINMARKIAKIKMGSIESNNFDSLIINYHKKFKR